jgi:prepilin-type N-terminal cleavage/methylation domain-containing protein
MWLGIFLPDPQNQSTLARWNQRTAAFDLPRSCYLVQLFPTSLCVNKCKQRNKVSQMRTQPRAGARHRKVVDQRGFTAVEVVMVMVISLAVAAMAIPGYSAMMRYLRIAGDVRDLNGMVAEAKMRAAQDFTHARVHADLTNNTFTLEYWDKTANGGAGCWKTDGDGVNRCTLLSGSPVQKLSPGVSFGTGTTSAGGLNPQTTIAQAPACSSGVAGGPTASTLPGSTACVEFNSRGLPLANSGSPTIDALYITDGNTVYGVTAIISGLIQIWTTTESGSNWQAR